MLETTYRTFTIGFKNNDTRFIIQGKLDFNKVVAKAIENGWVLDVDNVRELNRFDRFVTSKNKPTWLVECLYHEVLRVKQENTIKLNNM